MLICCWALQSLPCRQGDLLSSAEQGANQRSKVMSMRKTGRTVTPLSLVWSDCLRNNCGKGRIEMSILVHHTTIDQHFHNLIHSVWSSGHHLWHGPSSKTSAIQRTASFNPFSFPKSCCGFQKKAQRCNLDCPFVSYQHPKNMEKEVWRNENNAG